MNKVTAVILGLTLLAATAQAQTLSDREAIKAAMECFYQWDLYGGKENSSKCISDTVIYHRIDENGGHAFGTPVLDNDSGKGADALIHNLVDIDIYNDMAVVTSLHRYQPEAPRNTYVKNLVLFKLAEGWRISSVAWGRVTNTQ
ncbi:hypothetical protein R0137_03655 [Congregibacter brevis]|uniref:Nuclear transport factor 2 family protein n=1 Tax=Congregibacter brevis TaxID=3081201 RepID=A0ABZ0IEV6_9GAMM|nr:hypothetical protein R0137_03655 [Congregibacter sp. IMCC45268]